jgi:hypothetical protein
LGSKFKSSKYQPYVSGLDLPPALNSGEMHHFWMDTRYFRRRQMDRLFNAQQWLLVNNDELVKGRQKNGI